jgi:hypothetical protein
LSCHCASPQSCVCTFWSCHCSVWVADSLNHLTRQQTKVPKRHNVECKPQRQSESTRSDVKANQADEVPNKPMTAQHNDTAQPDASADVWPRTTTRPGTLRKLPRDARFWFAVRGRVVAINHPRDRPASQRHGKSQILQTQRPDHMIKHTIYSRRDQSKTFKAALWRPRRPKTAKRNETRDKEATMTTQMKRGGNNSRVQKDKRTSDHNHTTKKHLSRRDG